MTIFYTSAMNFAATQVAISQFVSIHFAPTGHTSANQLRLVCFGVVQKSLHLFSLSQLFQYYTPPSVFIKPALENQGPALEEGDEKTITFLTFFWLFFILNCHPDCYPDTLGARVAANFYTPFLEASK